MEGAIFTDIFWSSGLSSFFDGFGVDVLNAILNLVYTVLEFFLGWVNIPDFPNVLRGSIDTFLDLIFDNLSLLGFFIRPGTLKIIVPLFVVFFNFEFLYHIVMWIFNKAVALLDAVK